MKKDKELKEDLTYDQHPPDKEYNPTVLIVDDEEASRLRMVEICSVTKDARNLRVLSCDNVLGALEIVATETVDVVLLDKNMGPDETDYKQNGIEAIPHFLKVNRDLQILVVTGSKKISDAVSSIKNGASDFITKEMPDELIVAKINRAMEVARLSQENTLLTRGGQKISKINIAGHSKVIRHLKVQAQAVAESNRPVLLLGPSGTGKTTVAKMIHEARAQFLKQEGRSYLEINCGAFSPTLVERELFGNDMGAYTDAKVAKAGYFELANNGTLFLDEIAELSLDLQVKLLKVLQNGRFNRLGSTVERHSNFKLICATNRNIEQMVADGTFREDLFMRISVLIIKVPSLSERKEDIPDIVKALLPAACVENYVQVDLKDIPTDFIEYLQNHEIKGNIRGIEHLLTRLLIHAPRDKNNRPVLKDWASIPELNVQGAMASSGKEVLSLEDILNLPFDLIKHDFPGLKEILQLVEEKLFIEAQKKFGSSNKDLSTKLKISKAKVSLYFKHLNDPTKRFRKKKYTVIPSKPSKEKEVAL